MKLVVIIKKQLFKHSIKKTCNIDRTVWSDVFEEVSEIADEHYLTTSYDKVINIFGQFKQEAIALGLSELRWLPIY